MSTASEASTDGSEANSPRPDRGHAEAVPRLPGGSGDPSVDTVLADLERLELSLPPAELLATLLSAHESLAARLRAVEE